MAPLAAVAKEYGPRGTGWDDWSHHRTRYVAECSKPLPTVVVLAVASLVAAEWEPVAVRLVVVREKDTRSLPYSMDYWE